jgi:hypothetical protein
MQCYKIAITLQLTIYPFSVITSYKIVSHKAPNRIFAAVPKSCTKWSIFIYLCSSDTVVFCIWIIVEASRVDAVRNQLRLKLMLRYALLLIYEKNVDFDSLKRFYVHT